MAFTMEISHYTQTDQNWSVETWFLWPWPWLKKKPTLKLWLMPTRLLDLNALHMIMLIWCWCYIWQFIPTSTIRKKGVHSRNYWVGTLNYEAGNGNWWRLCNHERMLLIGLKVGRYGWKSLVWFFITYSGVNSWCPYRKCLCLATCVGQNRPNFTLTFD